MQHGFYFDHKRCVKCHACEIACKTWNEVEIGPRWREVVKIESGTYPNVKAMNVSMACMHCGDAPCRNACPVTAITKRADGIVLIDPEKAKGRKDLVEACPYGHIWWNEELELPQIWTFDAHLLDQGWKQTRGEQSCPTGAMKAIKRDDAAMQKMVEEEGLEVIEPELGTKPRVWYRNLWRYSKSFIGGSVSAEADGVVDCVEGAAVILLKEGNKVAEAVTDIYGDFKFDKLDDGSGSYTVEIAASGHDKKTVTAELGESIFLGEIRL